MRIFLRGTIDELIDQLTLIVFECGEQVKVAEAIQWERL